MALTPDQYRCLATRRTSDVIARFVTAGWKNDPVAILDAWWAPPTNHGIAEGDESAAYQTLDQYAAAVGCGGAGAGGSAAIRPPADGGGGILPVVTPRDLLGSNQATLGGTLIWWFDHDKGAFLLVTGIAGFVGWYALRRAAGN